MKIFCKNTLILCVLLAVLLFGSFSVAAAETDGDGMQISGTGQNENVTDGYNDARHYYFIYKTFTSYWEVFGAYATLGDAIQNNGYTYTAADDDPAQIGAKALAVIMMGGDPYNYKGKNLIQSIVDVGDDAAFAIPVFNLLALQAAGYDFDNNAALKDDLVEYCCNQLTDLELGPDIGGWALVALSRYVDDPAYQSEINTALATFEAAVDEQMSGTSMGSAGLSTGCVVTGFTALTAVGVEGYDVTTDDPWMTENPLLQMWNCYKDENNEISDFYNNQLFMEFSDLYNVLYKDGQPAWIACGVTKTKLDALKVTASGLLADSSLYTSGSVDRLQTAYDAVNGLTETELSEPIPTWGEEYYALYYAVQNCKEKGDAALMTDLDHSKWYYEMVSGVVEEGLMNGTSSTTFAPNANLTRAMMVQILYNMEGRPAYTIDNPFSDVADTAWYAAAVIWASEKGIAKGTGDGTTFAPNQAVTREQMAAFICRYAKVMGVTLTKGSVSLFSDDDKIASYAKDSVYTLVNEGIISGMGDGSFAPKATATRAQVARIIYCLIPKMEA